MRRSMGLTGQAATVDELLTGRENIRLIGRLYGLPTTYLRKATDDLLERFRLTDAADRLAKTYSGGMRRRLDLAVSLVAAPAGAVPRRADHRPRPAQPRRSCGTCCADLVRDGTTLLLTTQYLEEADQLADEIVVIDKGKVIAAGTPTQLKDQAGPGQRRRSPSPTPPTSPAPPSSCCAAAAPEVHVERGAAAG